MTPFEKRVADCYKRQGYFVLRNGWPDFLMLDRKGNVIAVEAKEKYDPLSPEQRLIHAFLGDWIPIRLVRPDDIAAMEKLPPIPFQDHRITTAAAAVARLRKQVMQRARGLQRLVSGIQHSLMGGKGRPAQK